MENWKNWSKIFADDLGWTIGSLFPVKVGKETPFQIDLKLPTIAQAKNALNKNRPLSGSIKIIWPGKPENPLKLTLPLPFHDVFLRRNNNGRKALSYIWIPFLGEAPGFRFIKKYSKTKKDTVWWKLGLMRGYYLEGKCGDKTGKTKGEERNKKFPGNTQILAPLEHYPEEIRNILPSASFMEACIGSSNKKITLSNIANVLDKLNKTAFRLMKSEDFGKRNTLDEDDLSHKILVTFPVWLKGSLCGKILEEVLTHKDAVEILSGKKDSTKEIQNKVWDSLVKRRNVIRNAIIPFENLVEKGIMSFIDPDNPVDMAALITRFQRFNCKSDILGKLPPIYRQNHPSFKGLVCPVQSPETEKVGITLHMSRGAFSVMDSKGSLTKESGAPDDELGFGAGIVPFYHHNDGARNMMGAKNLRQAMPLAKRSSPVITTGGEVEVLKLVQPLIDAGICPDACDPDGNLALGKDLLVAYLPWAGMNFEDAVVVGNQVVERGDLDTVKEEVFRHEIRQGLVPSPMVWQSIFPFDGLAKEGAKLVSGSIIASFSREGVKEEVPFEIKYRDRSPAILKDISFERTAPWTSGILEYTLIKKFPLCVGDKLMGRHGNKGVIGAILPEDKMPQLPDDVSIPANLRGRPADILLNPHGVISRMNLGQLLETHIGWLLHCGANAEDILLPEYKGKEKHIGRAFFHGIDHDGVQKLLTQYGLDEYGRVRLKLTDNGKTLSPVVIGFQHIVRLEHIPELKVQARRGGADARYSAGTGQAVHGRTRSGGQRIGEMEVWALAAYEVHAIIEEMLGMKSDVALMNALNKGEKTGSRSSFLSRFKDMLFALLINLDQDNRGINFSFLKNEDVLQKIGRKKRITSNDLFGKKISAVFSCQQGGKKECNFKLHDGKKIPVSPTKRIKPSEKNLTIRFEDLLESVGYKRSGPLLEEDSAFIQRLRRISDHKEDGALSLSFDNTSDMIKAVVIPHEKNRPERWPEKLKEVNLTGRFQKKGGKGNCPAPDIIDEMKKEDGRFNTGNLLITCPVHKTSNIKGMPPFVEKTSFCKGGMYDTEIFGSIDSAGLDNKPQWGVIELPVEVPYPVSAFLSKREREDIQPPVNIKFLPVLPLRYRLPAKGDDGYIADEIIRKGYSPILDTCRRYVQSDDEKKKEQLVKNLNYQVYKLFNMLSDKLKEKKGLIRKDGVGRRVDLSARLVITPDPALRWDQIGVPTPVLVELLGDELLDWVKNQGKYEDIVDRLLKALKMIEETNMNNEGEGLDFKVIAELLKNWSWAKGEKGGKALELFYNMLVKFLDSHKELLVILNRQPSLHKYSMQSFYPVPLKADQGDVLRISPLVCKGFGADFDGDEMALHLPLSEDARKEAKKLLPTGNMSSIATGKPLAHFDQDFILGTYWLGHNKSGMREEFLNLLQEECCKNMVPKDGMRKEAGERLLRHLIEDQRHKEHAPETIRSWMNLAFKCCSKVGVSFGFYELRELGISSKNRREEISNKMPENENGSIDWGKLNKLYQKIGMECLETVVKNPVMNNPGLHFAAMALSGARGAKQARQLLIGRGFLSPGDIPFEFNDELFFFPVSLTNGMNIEQAFYAAMNSRSSMCDKKIGTPHAGYLTRRLVFALWPYSICQQDCGSGAKTRTPLTCMGKRGFCAKCYGKLPGGELPRTGFPAGLIAAQSIGERGTQLSMQSFHTGERGINIIIVEEMLRQPGRFEKTEIAHEFINELKKNAAYKDIEDRHFQILWRVISESEKKTLASAISALGPLSSMAFESQKKNIFKAALDKRKDSLSDPVAKIICNCLKE